MLINNEPKEINCPVCSENNLHMTSVHSNGYFTNLVKIKFVCEHGCDVPNYLIVHRKGTTYTQWDRGSHDLMTP
jgi:hypothetical protein